MAIWWEDRALRVNRAIDAVVGQTGCSRSEALELLRHHAELAGSDLDETANAVIERRLTFGDAGAVRPACRRPKPPRAQRGPTPFSRGGTGFSQFCRPGSDRSAR